MSKALDLTPWGYLDPWAGVLRISVFIYIDRDVKMDIFSDFNFLDGQSYWGGGLYGSESP